VGNCAARLPDASRGARLTNPAVVMVTAHSVGAFPHGRIGQSQGVRIPRQAVAGAAW